MLGQKLGSYELLEEIGKGGMATVFRAHQESIKRDVAIKLIRKNIADTPEAVARFQREAQLIARLEHPHILPVYDFDGRHDPPYIVMRLLEGGTLKEVMAQGRLPLHEIAYLMQQVCSAVDYAHRQGIIHRDLKPSNILVDREGNAFVMDFGIARMAGSDAKGLTETGAIIGTPDYMSPEQVGGEVDHRTDIYALGVMLFEMLTGQLPFESPSSMGVLVMHLQNPVPSARFLNSELPMNADMVIQRALAKDREERYQTAAALSSAIIELVGFTGTQSPSQLREAAGTSIMRRIGLEKEDTTDTGSSEQNKTITALYASVKEYALLISENNGAEAAKRALNMLFKKFESVVSDFDGAVFLRTETDLLALWGTGTARETDAEQAIRAALTMQDELKVLGAAFLGDDEDDMLPLNIGINSGMALLKTGDQKSTASASGPTISIANRMMENANGTILITHDTFRQVMGIFDMAVDVPIKIRGRKDPLQTYRVLAAKARAFHFQQRGIEGLETRMIGRDAELKLLQNALLNAFEDHETQVLTVLSDAGIGKSRLLYELDKWADLRPEKYRVFNGRATSAMRDRPYALLRDVVSFRFDIQDNDDLSVVQDKLEKGVDELLRRKDPETAHLIGYLCGFDLSKSPHVIGKSGDVAQLVKHARQAFVNLIIGICAIQPVVITLEDIHYADDPSLDLMNELFEANDEVPMVIVCNARPALLETRPTWGSGQTFHNRVELKPLGKRESRELALELLQKVPDVPKELRDLLVDRSEGNPFYMEELVKMLIDERVIQTGDDEWRVELSRLGALNVPKTLNGLLESRLDTLLYPEKLTLQRASVMGRIFYDSALHKIDDCDEMHVSQLEKVLAKLVEYHFIYKREASSFEGVTEYIFASNMLRDAIVNALLERQVTTYNRAAAEWLIEIAGNRQDEYAPLIAEYYENAGDHISAADFLVKAAQKSIGINALDEALKVLRHALDILPPDDPAARQTRLSALVELVSIFYERWQLDQVEAAGQEALALARELGDPTLIAYLLAHLGLNASRRGGYREAREYMGTAETLIDAIEDKTILVFVLRQIGNVYGARVETVSRATAYLERSLQTALDTGNLIGEAAAYNALGNAYAAPGDWQQAIVYYEKSADIAYKIGYESLRAVALSNIGEMYIRMQDYDQAIEYYQRTLTIYRTMGSNLGNITSQLALALAQTDAVQDEVIVYLKPSLDEALAHDDLSILYTCLDACVHLLIRVEQYERAAEVIGLNMISPIYDPDDPGIKSQLDRDMNHLMQHLSPEIVQAAIERGKTLDAVTVAKGLYAEFCG